MYAWIPLFLIILASISATKTNGATNMLNASTITKPGCQPRCGNLPIPYPFGIGSQCSPEYWYEIVCNTSFNPPKPFLGKGNFEIVEISETHMKIKNWVAKQCYYSNGTLTDRNAVSIDLWALPFSYSDTLKLVVVGCDDVGIINGTTRGRNFQSGCSSSLCSREQDLLAGPCSGLGCSQIPIPSGLKQFSIRLQSLNNHIDVSSFDKCGYAFLAEDGNFSFRGAADFSDPLFYNRTVDSVPVVLEWNVGNGTTCSEAQQNQSSYECKQNSNCTDVDFGSKGYRCSCLPGYEGNPYLTPGCTDIDECAGPINPCFDPKRCKNTPGKFTCSCPEGHHGDGRKNGSGCVSNNSQLDLKVTLGLGISLGSISLFIILYGLFLLVKARKVIRQRKINFRKNGGLLFQQQLSTREGAFERSRVFTCDELERATDNFNENRILGRGGQGTVYKGMLLDGTIVAIKKSNKVNESQLGQFINEVVILSQINHRNVVKLFGCCLETEVPLLIYEFVLNDNLYRHIHNPKEDFRITWKMRLQIAIESAEALRYLHSSSSTPIYHRDIKTSNILLDETYRAKIADFGISRTISVDQTHVTTNVQGTFGYIDPEYFQSHQFTEKSDVYSFGVVLLELLTSKKPVYVDKDMDPRSLASEFLLCMQQSRLCDLVDADVLQEAQLEVIEGVADLAKRCLRLNGNMRPTMHQVSMTLQSILAQNDVPHSSSEHVDHSGKKDQMYMVNEGLFSISPPPTSTDDSFMYTQPLLFDTDSSI